MAYSGEFLDVDKAHHIAQCRLRAWALVKRKQSSFLLGCKAERWAEVQEVVRFPPVDLEAGCDCVHPQRDFECMYMASFAVSALDGLVIGSQHAQTHLSSIMLEHAQGTDETAPSPGAEGRHSAAGHQEATGAAAAPFVHASARG